MLKKDRGVEVMAAEVVEFAMLPLTSWRRGVVMPVTPLVDI